MSKDFFETHYWNINTQVIYMGEDGGRERKVLGVDFERQELLLEIKGVLTWVQRNWVTLK